jgi:hypothetical protein
VGRIALPVLLGLLLAGCGGTRTAVRTTTVVRAAAAPSPPADQRIFGTIRSIERDGGGYLLRLDPVWFTSGITADVAQAADQGLACRPRGCPPVANDNYRIDEGHRLLTYVLPAGTRGTVLVGGLRNLTVTAAELARLVAGTSTLKLFEPLSTGVWLLVHVDTVRSFAQQYRP